MDKDPAGNIPPSAPESKPAVEAPAPTSSLPSHESALSERAKSANSPAAIRAIIEEAKKPAPPQPAPIVPEAKPEADAPAAEAPEGDTPDAKAQGDADPEAPDETPEADDADDGEGPIKVPTAKQLRISPAEHDQVGRLTAALMRRNRDWSMEDALQAAKKQLGIKPAAEAPAEAAAKSDFPQTVEATEQTLESLEDEMDKANIALEFEKAVELRKQIRKLERHRNELAEQAKANEAEAVNSFNRQFDRSFEQAKEVYAFVNEPESPAYKRMLEIQEDLKTLGDPVYFSADKPLKLAQMAAGELGIAPRRKGAPTTPAKAAVTPPAAPPKPKQVLPTGGSRTVVQTSTPETAVLQEVAGITKVHQLRQFMNKIGARR